MVHGHSTLFEEKQSGSIFVHQLALYNVRLTGSFDSLQIYLCTFYLVNIQVSAMHQATYSKLIKVRYK